MSLQFVSNNDPSSETQYAIRKLGIFFYKYYDLRYKCWCYDKTNPNVWMVNKHYVKTIYEQLSSDYKRKQKNEPLVIETTDLI